MDSIVDLPAISPQAIEAVVEVITGGPGHDPHPTVGIYRSASRLERFFQRCGLAFAVGGSSRVPAVREFLADIDRTATGPQVLRRVIETAVDPRDFIGNEPRLQATVDYLNAHLRLDGLELIAQGHRWRLARLGGFSRLTETLVEQSLVLDLDTVHRDTERALQQASGDPEDAVTAACSMLESVCRSILVELGEPLPSKKDLNHLVGAVQGCLNLSPTRSDLPKETEDDIRRILGGLATVANGIGALRTHAGDAHGRERGFRRVDRRIACLAIHAASTIALFLIETWQRREKAQAHGP